MFEGTPWEVGVVFGSGGTPMTHGQMAKEEFGAGLDHMMLAATHAAGGMGTTLGPRMTNMRSMMMPAAGRVRDVASSGWESFAPIMAAARDGAREATEAALMSKARAGKRQKGSQVKQRRIGMALGLLAAGAMVGAVAGLVVRRRRRNAWEDYDASEALESMMDTVSDRPADVRGGRHTDMFDTATGMSERSGDPMRRSADRTNEVMERAEGRAAEMGGQTGDRFAGPGDRRR
jgi:hypothetical protein